MVRIYKKMIIGLIVIFFIFLTFSELITYKYHVFIVGPIFLLLTAFTFGRGGFKIKDYFFLREDLAFWVYLISISFNIWFASDMARAWNFYQLLSFTAILIYFAIKNSKLSYYNLARVLYAYCLCAAFVSLFGLAEFFSGSNFIYVNFFENIYYNRFIGKRIMSTFVHSNILGCYLIPAVPLAYYFYKENKSIAGKIANYLVFILILAALMFTLSRGTWLALLLAFFIYCIIKKRIKLIFFICGIAILFFVLATQPFLPWEIRGRFGISSLSSFLDYVKNYHRTLQYSVTANMLKNHLWVGVGLEHYRKLFGQYAAVSLPYEVMIPDSIYLMHLAETGLTGFLCLSLFLWTRIRNAFENYGRLQEKDKGFQLAIMLAFFSLLFNMAFFDGFLWRSSLYLFWIYSALIGVVKQRA